MKYKKTKETSYRVIMNILIIVTLIVCHTIIIYNNFIKDNLYKNIVFLLATIVVSLFYPINNLIKDTKMLINEKNIRFKYDNKNDIPFVDRKEIIREILETSLNHIKDNKYYYRKNIRYEEHSGKSSLSKRICYELQKIKDNESDLNLDIDNINKKIGNIFYVDYSNHMESFNTDIKSMFTYIKGKKNIIVVNNSCSNPFIWNNDLKDKDIFFIFLNFNSRSEVKLFFPDDKIVELLRKLTDNPRYERIKKICDKKGIENVASTLASLSHNNIGTIVDLLTSNEFELLLSTNEYFIDFYFEIKNGNYSKAQDMYSKLSDFNINNPVFKYKKEFELANLNHFLGKYDESLKQLDQLKTEIQANILPIDLNISKGIQMDIALLEAHVNKHLGKFDTAINVLKNASLMPVTSDESIILPLQRAHFSICIFQLNKILYCINDSLDTHYYDLLDNLNKRMETFKNKRSFKNSDYYFYEAYFPIVKFYLTGFNKQYINELINLESLAIEYYEEKEKRYLTNCYFITAELYRVNTQWENATEYYRHCYDVYCNNGDKDILYLLAYTCKAIYISHKIKLDIDPCFDWNAIIENCKQDEGYPFHQHLISLLEIIESNPAYFDNWKKRFDIIINPIP